MRNALASILARIIRPLAAALVLGCGGLSLAASAQAGGWHGGHWHGGGCCWGGPRFSLFFGFPAFYPYPDYAYYPPYPYPYPAYSYAPSYYPPAYPPVALAQQAPPPGPPPVQYWYYCDNPRGFYPYVQSCGAAWRPVPAQPPGVQTP